MFPSHDQGGQKRKKSEAFYEEEEKSNKRGRADSSSSSGSSAPSDGGSHRSISTGLHGTMSNGGEVEVVPPPKRVSKIAPDYFTIRLPQGNTNLFTAQTTTTTGDTIGSKWLKLNSINTTSNMDVVAEPRGRDTWTSLFQYYRVLQCDVKMTWTNNTHVGATGFNNTGSGDEAYAVQLSDGLDRDWETR